MAPNDRWSGRPSSTSRASTMSPAHVPSTGRPSASSAPSGSRNSDESSSLLIVVDSPPGQDQRVERAELPGAYGRRPLRRRARRAPHDARETPPAAPARRSSLPDAAPGAATRTRRASDCPPRIRPPGAPHDRHQPRSASLTSRVSMSSPRIASPRPRETLATMLGVVEVRGGLDDRLGARRRVGRS